MQIDLATVTWHPTRHAGVALHWFHSDPSTGHAAVLIRMDPGASYPAHRHRGVEELLVLQGSYHDEFGEHAAGDYARYEPGSYHTPVCSSADPCVFFAIAHEGIVVAKPG
jgi:anti-sigma factor ChrR (cupin superfamily)